MSEVSCQFSLQLIVNCAYKTSVNWGSEHCKLHLQNSFPELRLLSLRKAASRKPLSQWDGVQLANCFLHFVTVIRGFLTRGCFYSETPSVDFTFPLQRAKTDSLKSTKRTSMNQDFGIITSVCSHSFYFMSMQLHTSMPMMIDGCFICCKWDYLKLWHLTANFLVNFATVNDSNCLVSRQHFTVAVYNVQCTQCVGQICFLVFLVLLLSW